MKKILCFFGIHNWDSRTEGWSAFCTRCNRSCLADPHEGGYFCTIGWFEFWFRYQIWRDGK